MRFKLDENVPVEAGELLRQSGHDVLTVVEEELGGETDPKKQSSAHFLGVVERLLRTISTEPMEGHLWIVEEERIRIRG